MLQIYFPKQRHGGKNTDISQSVVGQIQIFQRLEGRQRLDRGKTAVFKGQFLQIGQSSDDFQIIFRGSAIVNVKFAQKAQRDQILKLRCNAGTDGKLFQIGQVFQVTVVLHIFRHGQRGDGPKLIGIDRTVVIDLKKRTNFPFKCRIGEYCRLDNTTDCISKNRQGTDKTIVGDRKSINRCLTAAQCDRIGIRHIGDRRILSVGAYIQGTIVGGQRNINVLTVKTGGRVCDRSGGTQGIQLLFDRAVTDVIQHIDGIQQFVLLDICTAQSHV